MRQVNAGQLKLPERVVSIFDPEARPIRRGKAHRENEFGYKVRLTESAERLITEYTIIKGNPAETRNCSSQQLLNISDAPAGCRRASSPTAGFGTQAMNAL